MGRPVTALVLGGTGAVGSQIIEILLERKAKVIATSRDGKRLNSRSIPVQWNAENSLPLSMHLDKEDRHLLVFYCVGASSSKMKVSETDCNEFRDLFEVNVLGFVRVLHAIKTCTLESVDCVAISSDATVSARALNGPYSASKSALEIVSRTIASEEGSEFFRFNVLAPSLIDSEMARSINRKIGNLNFQDVTSRLPMGRAISPEEVARAAVDLAGAKQWSYTNGQVFRISSPPR
ncbi:MAG: SDR family oxidoreductase [Verrucomicrobiota bacterium]